MVGKKYSKLAPSDGLRSEHFRGTAVAFVVRPKTLTAFQGDFELMSECDTQPMQVRAFRQGLRRKGKAVPKLKSHQLSDEVVIMFGPAVSAVQATVCLNTLIKQIRKRGLLTGRGLDGDYEIEAIEPKPTIVI